MSDEIPDSGWISIPLPGGRHFWGPKEWYVAPPAVEELDSQVIDLVRDVSSKLRMLRSEIITQIRTSGGELDEDGFYVVAFDAEKMSPEQAMDLTSQQRPEPRGVIDANFAKSRTDERAFFVNLSAESTSGLVADIGETDDQKVTLKIRNHELTLDTNGQLDYTSLNNTSLQSDDKYALFYDLQDLNEVLKFKKPDGSGKYHWRIFGIHAQYSQQRPSFILASPSPVQIGGA